MIAAVTLVPVGLTPARRRAPAMRATTARLPNRFAPYSFLTATSTGRRSRGLSRCTRNAQQRARGLVPDDWQVVLLDADGDRYRQHPASRTRSSRPAGLPRPVRGGCRRTARRLAIHRSVDRPSPLARPDHPRLVVLDLATGSARPFPRISETSPASGLVRPTLAGRIVHTRLHQVDVTVLRLGSGHRPAHIARRGPRSVEASLLARRDGASRSASAWRSVSWTRRWRSCADCRWRPRTSSPARPPGPRTGPGIAVERLRTHGSGSVPLALRLRPDRW